MHIKSLILGLAALLLSSCVARTGENQEQASMRVKTMVITPQAALSTSRYVGTIEPIHETPLALQTTGRIVSVDVKNGDHVRKGQAILSVDNTQALNALKGAEAAYIHAKDGHTRASRVHTKGVVSDQKMVEIESQYAQAKSLYEAAKQQLKECTLIAPCDGIISGLETEKGQTVIPGTQLCSILDISGFCVRFTVPEGEINGITDEGMKGIVECAAVGEIFPIHITEKSASANPVTHTYTVVATIDGGTDVLRSGMVAKVQIQPQQPSADERIVIPTKCVLLKPEGHTIWVVEKGRAVRRIITVEGYQADGVRVLSGLQTGDTLITEGYQKLYNNCIIENE